MILPPLNDARFQAGPVLIGVWAGVKMSQASSRSGFGNWFNQVAAGVRAMNILNYYVILPLSALCLITISFFARDRSGCHPVFVEITFSGLNEGLY